MNEVTIIHQNETANRPVIKMQVACDDMAPEFPIGTTALARKVNEQAFLEWNEVYVLDTVNCPIMKRINPTGSKSSILFMSSNQNYPAFEVRLSDVFGFYRVLGSVTRH
jgi:hypothetical protein